MALEEVSFYNLNGEEINLTNLVEQMIDYYQQKLEAGQTRITDFNEGSEIRNLLEAFAVGIYGVLEEETEGSKLPFIYSSYGEWLDHIGENPFINLPRVQGAEATGIVTFTLSTAQTGNYIIPAETIIVDNVTGLEYYTITDGFIPVGETTVNVQANCLTSGVDGNCSEGRLTIISDVNTDINRELLSVTNNYAFTDGADFEEDDDYRNRLLENVRADGFGTKGYYIKLAESVTGVHDAILTNQTGYTGKVLVNGFNKPVEDTVILNVLSQFTDSKNIVLGHNFNVGKCGYTVPDSIEIKLNVSSTISNTILTNILTAFVNGGSYDRFDFTGLKIGEPLTLAGIRECLEALDGVIEVTDLKYNSNSVDKINPTNDEYVIQLGTLSFTQTEV